MTEAAPRLVVSRYLTISEHAYEGASGVPCRLLFSGRSGAALTIDEHTAAKLLRGEVPADEATVATLLRAEIVVPASEDELQAISARNQRQCADETKLTYVVVPTSYCNMGCSYCGQTHSKDPAGDEWEKALVAYILEGIRRPTTQRIQINWFGGEPMAAYPRLMHVSRTLTHLAEEADLGYAASLTTNGSLLTLSKLIELHRTARVSAVTITLDGPPALHDRRRLLKSGGTSFHHITRLIAEALQEPLLDGMQITIRTNIDRDSRDAVPAFLHQMKALGFDHPRIAFDLAPVHSWSNDVSGVAIEPQAYAAEEIGWLVTMMRLGLRFMLLPSRPRPVACVAVTPAASVISSTGAIFSCTEHVLVPRHEARDALAHLRDGPAPRRRLGLFDDFNQRVGRHELPCSDCRVFGMCGGACPKQWSEGTPPCPSFKYNLQARLDLTAVRRGLRVL